MRHKERTTTPFGPSVCPPQAPPTIAGARLIDIYLLIASRLRHDNYPPGTTIPQRNVRSPGRQHLYQGVVPAFILPRYRFPSIVYSFFLLCIRVNTFVPTGWGMIIILSAPGDPFSPPYPLPPQRNVRSSARRQLYERVVCLFYFIITPCSYSRRFYLRFIANKSAVSFIPVAVHVRLM